VVHQTREWRYMSDEVRAATRRSLTSPRAVSFFTPVMTRSTTVVGGPTIQNGGPTIQVFAIAQGSFAWK